MERFVEITDGTYTYAVNPEKFTTVKVRDGKTYQELGFRITRWEDGAPYEEHAEPKQHASPTPEEVHAAEEVIAASLAEHPAEPQA